jgi:aquaporin Z
MWQAVQRHYPEYLMEAAGLGLFMVSAAVFTVLIEHPGSPIRMGISEPFIRRLLIGLAMGLTAVAIIYSPWGQQSGAHLNPAVTLTFFRLGKIEGWDAAFYVLGQFSGGVLGVLLVTLALGRAVASPDINYVATVPGPDGPVVAFAAELGISFLLMLVVLLVSNSAALSRLTGLFAGLLVATYITVEAPLSGMSMNPARTFSSALPAHLWTTLWIYFTAPPIGMLTAAECYLRMKGAGAVICAKLHHQNSKRCIFICGYMLRRMS